ncbi:MAG: helix-turn-helix domain-containing protein [Lachnospiraceae bacterium]|nr:helix-turn-helix domain-containing protein [Lachnospiraceae bacterium]
MYLKKEFGKRLREIRHQQNMTQEQFAEMLDISIQLYKKMETGENNITLSTLNKMKNKLNFSADYLLFGEKDTLMEVWDKALTLDSMDKQLLLFKLFCEVSLNNSQIEFKEAAEKYNMIFEKIRELLSDWDEDGKENPDTGR